MTDRGASQEAVDHCNTIKESTLAKCMDGVDNDGNGYADCADRSCSDSVVPDIAMYCQSIGENTFEKCTDGVDNDGNGYVDCGDFSCSQADDIATRRACQETAVNPDEDPNVFCTDGVDNDADSFVDCDDADCILDPAVTVCERTWVCR
jgi:hypothetical protein